MRTMDPQEEYKFHNSYAPIDSFASMKESAEKWCKDGNPDNARHILNLFNHVRVKNWRRSEAFAAQYSAMATTVLFAYAKAGKKEKCEELLQEMQTQPGARGEPLFDIGMLRQTIKMQFGL